MLYTELKPKLYKQKSYYSKARVIDGGHFKTLYSYGIKMVELYKNDIVSLNSSPENYTQTTLKHVKDFLYQTLGLTNLTKGELLKMQENINSNREIKPKKVKIPNF